jgi:hypothetical protein
MIQRWQGMPLRRKLHKALPNLGGRLLARSRLTGVLFDQLLYVCIDRNALRSGLSNEPSFDIRPELQCDGHESRIANLQGLLQRAPVMLRSNCGASCDALWNSVWSRRSER